MPNDQSPTSQVEKRVSVFRKAHFNAAHRLNNPKWTDEKNKEIFGLCNSPNYHGHNYDLEVRITGEVDSDTGYVYDLGYLAKLIKIHVENAFDHKNLNLDCPEFANLIPSAENIAITIWEKLRPHIEKKYDLHIRLYETPRNFVEFPA